MRPANAPLRPSETSLIIQSVIEGLTPQQVMVCDKLVREGVPQDVAKTFVEYYDEFQKSIPELAAKLRERGVDERVIKYLTEKTLAGIGESMADQLAERA